MSKSGRSSRTGSLADVSIAAADQAGRTGTQRFVGDEEFVTPFSFGTARSASALNAPSPLPPAKGVRQQLLRCCRAVPKRAWILMAVALVSLLMMLVIIRQWPGNTKPTPATPLADAGFGAAEHVVIIGLDGLGGRFLRAGDHPFIDDLLSKSAYTLSARSVLPTMSGPNWGTILTGADLEDSGIDTNDWFDPAAAGCTKLGFTSKDCVACAECQLMYDRITSNLTALGVARGATPPANVSDADRANIITTATINLPANCSGISYVHGTSSTRATICSTVAGLLLERALASSPSVTGYQQCQEFLVPGIRETACQQQLPSIMTPHASIPPFFYGIQPINATLQPSVFDVVKDHFSTRAKELSPTTLLYTDIGMLFNFVSPPSIDESMLVEHDFDGLVRSFDQALQRFGSTTRKFPRLMFLHNDVMDGAGHGSGHGSSAYYKALAKLDGQLQTLFASVNRAGIASKTLVLITADHGGLGFSHGSVTDQQVEVPFFAYGAGVVPKRMKGYVRNADVVATALHALGVSVPWYMSRSSLPQVQIFSPDPSDGWKALQEKSLKPVAAQRERMQTKRSIVIDVSGLSSLVLRAARGETSPFNASMIPSVVRLVNNSVSTAHARGTYPCERIVSLASILTMTQPAQHGVCNGSLSKYPCFYQPLARLPPDLQPFFSSDTMWNDQVSAPWPAGSYVLPPTAFTVAKRQPKSSSLTVQTALFYQSTLVDAFIDATEVDVRKRNSSDSGVLASVMDHLSNTRALLTNATARQLIIVEMIEPFAKLAELMAAAEARSGRSVHHVTSALMDPAYAQAVQEFDTRLGTLLDAIDSADRLDGIRSQIILTADVSAPPASYQAGASGCLLVPFVMQGPGITPSMTELDFRLNVRNIDAIATALSSLGLELPPATLGRPVFQI